MKTLKQIAASFNLYKIEDLPDTHKTERNNYKIVSEKQNIPDFLTKMDSIEVGLFYQCQTQDKGTDKEINFIEHYYILIKGNESDNLLMLMKDRNNKYDFHPYYAIMRKFQNVSYYIKDTATKHIIKPNLIGVFNAKKVNDWVSYCNEYIAALQSCIYEVDKKNEEIEKQISDFIKSLPAPEVQEYQNTTWVNTPKFQVIFKHFKDQKYLSTEITFKGSLQDITNITNTIK